MKKPYYTEEKNGSRLEIYECNVGLLGKVFNKKTNLCTMSEVFKDTPTKKVTIEDIKNKFSFR